MNILPHDQLVLQTICEFLEHANLNRVDVHQIIELCRQQGLTEEDVRTSVASLARLRCIDGPDFLIGIEINAFSLTPLGFEQYIIANRPDLMELVERVYTYLHEHPKFKHDERVSGGEVAAHFSISPVFSNQILDLLSSRGQITLLKIGQSGQILLVTGLPEKAAGMR